jgi:maltoporin
MLRERRSMRVPLCALLLSLPFAALETMAPAVAHAQGQPPSQADDDSTPSGKLLPPTTQTPAVSPAASAVPPAKDTSTTTPPDATSSVTKRLTDAVHSLTTPSEARAPGPAGDDTLAPPSVGHNGQFEFGSYGRVQIASDLRGGTGRQANIVSNGTRIDEDSYAELELRREDSFEDGIKNKVVTTLALFPPFFHFSGDATQNIALRNLYDQATYGPVTMWVGSRMYRGDDIYLLDWWPLDNQNTVGGGIGVNLPPTSFGETSIAAHVGLQRLDNATQFEQIPVVAPFGVGTTNVTVLDRPRMTETLKITQLVRNSKAAHPFADDDDKRGFKFILYGEAQEISAGVYTDTTVGTSNNTQTPYAADSGFLVGGEIAYWTGKRDTFIQVFARYAHGLAAYDPLSEPTAFSQNNTTNGANEALFAVGGNYEVGAFGLLYGAYFRYFTAGDPQPTSIQTYDEGTIDVRPQLFIGEHWGIAIDGSYQARQYAELDPTTNSPLYAAEWRGGIIPYFSPSGRGSYKRPQLRLLYAVTARNEGARALYATQDVFSQRSIEHYLGLGVEWWFNSSSYP